MPSEPQPSPNTPEHEIAADTTGGGTKASRFVVSAPVDAIALAAYMVGFHPSFSLVVIGVTDQNRVMLMRRDLPPAHQVNVLNPELRGTHDHWAHPGPGSLVRYRHWRPVVDADDAEEWP